MKWNLNKSLVVELLQSAGIQINGHQAWDIQIHNDEFYQRVLKDGSLGLGEAYMDRWWNCERIDLFIDRIVKSNLQSKIKTNKRLLLKMLIMKFVNFQTKRRSLEVGRKHYDINPQLFQAMLDSSMNYSCGYWRHATNLEEAQIDKMELSCQKLKLKPGMRLLDIGCGFGGLAKYAAQNYGVEVVGVTISKEQQQVAQKACAGFPVDIRFQDYRDINETFDRVISIGMFEHVGYLNYNDYFNTVNRCLKDDGIFLLHTIGSNVSLVMADEWISKYIFPNGMLPSISQIGKATEAKMVMEDWHNFGADYDKTLMAWYENFNRNWDRLKHLYDDRFYRMWNYYLLACAGTFRARDIQLWQMVFTKTGLKGGYQAPRDV